MYRHQPKDYDCPFCRFTTGQENELNKREYIIYEDSTTMAFVAPDWRPNNPGHVIVIPKEHIENIYMISDSLLGEIYKTVKKMAIGLKTVYQCDGTSTLQHNEPDGNQEVWHMHVHVFPRYKNDDLYKRFTERNWVSHKERLVYVEKIREYFKKV